MLDEVVETFMIFMQLAYRPAAPRLLLPSSLLNVRVGQNSNKPVLSSFLDPSVQSQVQVHIRSWLGVKKRPDERKAFERTCSVRCS